MEYAINIGICSTNVDSIDAVATGACNLLRALADAGIPAAYFRVDGTGDEYTLVAHVENASIATLRGHLYFIAESFGEDCIAYQAKDKTMQGLVGPDAPSWAPFNPVYFLER